MSWSNVSPSSCSVYRTPQNSTLCPRFCSSTVDNSISLSSRNRLNSSWATHGSARIFPSSTCKGQDPSSLPLSSRRVNNAGSTEVGNQFHADIFFVNVLTHDELAPH